MKFGTFFIRYMEHGWYFPCKLSTLIACCSLLQQKKKNSGLSSLDVINLINNNAQNEFNLKDV